jgi:hypothetical protein
MLSTCCHLSIHPAISGHRVLQETSPLFSLILQPNASPQPASLLASITLVVPNFRTERYPSSPSNPSREGGIAHVVLMDYGSLGSWGDVLEPRPAPPIRLKHPCRNEIRLVKWASSHHPHRRSACFSLSSPEALLSRWHYHHHPFSIWCLYFNPTSLQSQTTLSYNAFCWKDFDASCRCTSKA